MIEPFVFLCGACVLCYLLGLWYIHKPLASVPPTTEVSSEFNVFRGAARWIVPSQTSVVGAVTWRNFQRRQAIHAAMAKVTPVADLPPIAPYRPYRLSMDGWRPTDVWYQSYYWRYLNQEKPSDE